MPEKTNRVKPLRKLITVPPHLIEFGRKHLNQQEYYLHSDPREGKIGSGGGTAWLLYNAYREETRGESFWQWLEAEKRMIIHAGGQSRRLPAYAAVGKILTPIPVFRWKRGQQITQTLLDLQLPLYEEILSRAPAGLSTLIASGDVLIRNDDALPPIPQADVVVFGLWEQAEKASAHGVFFTPRNNPSQLEFMLQKPSAGKIEELQPEHLFLIDIGVWLLSPRAMKVLFNKSGWNTDSETFSKQVPDFYDLYATFGPALGGHPTLADPDINALSTAVVPLTRGEFYHFGTSAELVESSNKLQCLVKNQQEIWQNKVKPSPDLFTQNALTGIRFTAPHHSIWIENSCVGEGWQLENKHIITGVPLNNWHLRLPAETCLDLIPVGNQGDWCIRVYGFYQPQLPQRGRKADRMPEYDDWFEEPVYPVVGSENLHQEAIQQLIDHPWTFDTLRGVKKLLSAAEIAGEVNLERQYAQRRHYLRQVLPLLAQNWRRSVFYQLDLKHAASLFHKESLGLPSPLPDTAPLLIRLHDQMFRSQVTQLDSEKEAHKEEARQYERNAFELLRDVILEEGRHAPVQPELSVLSDQIVWGRSPIRLDIAGGWTDTPPYCLINGGKVVNLAVELNGQPPLQVFIKPTENYKITLRSIDLGMREEVSTFAELRNYHTVGSAFSIPKAALCLAGFLPEYSLHGYPTLEEQLHDFGAGIEITLLAAIPKGSGLGTSSILASTVLGTISDFCKLGWDKYTICSRTLMLEQMLTTGGGWQDQVGGVFGGVKLIESQPGIIQQPRVRWAPEHVFREATPTILLYYTGITRVARNILAEIVKGMFLNGKDYLRLLEEMKRHALYTYEAIQQNDLQKVAEAVGLSGQYNQQLDAGTDTPEIRQIISQIEDYLISYKLPGAGGGGYMYLFTKDAEAALRIRTILTRNPPNRRARFVEWSLSGDGFKVTRS